MKARQMLLTMPFIRLATLAILSLSLSGRAVTVSYYVDSGLSSLSLTGNAFGLNFTGQGGNANALKDFWGGTIKADFTGGVLTFTGGSAITANLNALGPFSTVPFPSTPGGDAYGPTATGFVTGYGLVTVNAAYRNLTFDITAGTAAYGVAPSASGITFQFTAGNLDWGATTGLGPTGGTSSLIGVNGLDTSSRSVILSPSALPGDVLILPVSVHTIGSNRNEYWEGTLVAVIPEPSSAALVGLGFLGFSVLQFRRTRR